MYKMWLNALVVLTLSLFPSTAIAEEKQQELVNKLAERTYTGDLDEIRQRKVLRALVVYSKTDFFFTDELHPKGLQADLLQQLDKSLNAGIKQQELKTIINYIPTTFDNLLNDLEVGRGDIAAHLLTITPERKKRVNFATSGALKVNELVVAHKDVLDINKPEDLAGRTVYVLKGSSYEEHLRELNANLNKMGLVPVTIIAADPRLRSEDIMELVNAGAVKLTIIDDYKAKLWSRVLPDIQVLENVIIKADTTVGWAVRKNNPKLLESLMALTKTVKKGSLIGNMFFKSYYHSTKWIDNPLSDEKRAKLLDLIDLFKKYAGKYSFDYLALAAQAYQESQLDHSRISPAGALGIMQLLPSTAADPNINIADIKELENNIHAGVKYMDYIRNRYYSDPEIAEEDKLAFSWASYNAGPANVRRMRQLAAEMGLNSNIWFNNVEMAAGKIVGRETVQYVSNIFKYYIAYNLIRDRIDAL